MRAIAPFPIVVFFALAFCSVGGTGRSQTVQEVQRKFGDLRDDNVPLNASNATAWLFVRRDKLKGAMLEELYRTDRQGRDAILQILFQTPSFVPDERFLRFVVARLGEEDTYVKNRIIDTVMHYERQPNGEPGVLNGFKGAHHDAWNFIDTHFEAFSPLLTEQIAKAKSMWTLWGTAWLFKSRGVLPEYTAKYTPEVLALVAGNLRNDEMEGNASQAARLFLILSDQSLPALRQAAKSPDTQQRSLAQALIDALTGSRAGLAFSIPKSG